MKKNIFIFGSVASVILCLLVFIPFTFYPEYCNSEYSMFIGYGSMIVAFAFIFAAIKNYRDQYNGGIITFGKAFTIGLCIALIGSTAYVVMWMIEFQYFVPDFMEKYSAHQMALYKAGNHTAAEIAKMKADLDAMTASYHNPMVRIGFTYMEVLPVGLLVALIAALILKRKHTANATAVTA